MPIFRRHLRTCKHTGRKASRCACPIWADIRTLDGKRILKSTSTRDWDTAEAIARDWSEGRTSDGHGCRVPWAVEKYLEDQAQALATSTVYVYSQTLRRFAKHFENRTLSSIRLGELTDYQRARQVAASTAGKEIEVLKSFFKRALDYHWVKENTAAKLTIPKNNRRPTLPFSEPEVAALLDACDRLGEGNPNHPDSARLKAKARMLVLLRTGLRISDVVQLRKSQVDLNSGEIMIRVMKTGQPLYLWVSSEVTDALRALNAKGEYFFWSGKSELHTACNVARLSLKRAAAIANVFNAHPHRFRDTFAVRLLNAGYELRTVQVLLGHRSILTTERYYAPFVESSQRRITEALKSIPAEADMKKDLRKDTQALANGGIKRVK